MNEHQEPDTHYFAGSVLNPLSPNSPLNPMSRTYKKNFALDIKDAEWEKAKDELIEHTLILYEKEKKLEDKEQLANNIETEQKEKSQRYYMDLAQAQALQEKKFKQHILAMQESELKESIAKRTIYIAQATKTLNQVQKQVTQLQTIITQQNNIIQQAHVNQMNRFLGRIAPVLGSLTPQLILNATNQVPLNLHIVNGQSQVINQAIGNVINNMPTTEQVSRVLINSYSPEVQDPKVIETYTGLNPSPTPLPITTPSCFKNVRQMVNKRECELAIKFLGELYEHFLNQKYQINIIQIKNAFQKLNIIPNFSDFVGDQIQLVDGMDLQNKNIIKVMGGERKIKLLQEYIEAQNNCIKIENNQLHHLQSNSRHRHTPR